MMIFFSKKTDIAAVFIMVSLFIFHPSLNAKQEFLLDEKTHEALTKVHSDMDAGKNEDALTKLKKIASTKGIKSHDAAVVYQTMAFVENSLNRLENAANYFIKALSYNALPQEVTHQLQYSTAQLLIHIDKPKEGLTYLTKWFANEPKPKADAYILAATAHYYTEDYKQLIANAEKALTLIKKPPVNWYELLLAGYYELKDYKGATSVLENIISKYPGKSNYWLQLAGIYQQLDQEGKALALYELAYAKGILNKDEILQLIRSYRYLDMPYKAATLIEKEMAIGDLKADKETLTLLVDSWVLAEETDKAKSVFLEIINRFDDDRARLRLGQIYIDDEEWNDALKILDVKLETEDKKLVSKINLLLGIAQYYSDDFNAATQAFTNSLSDAETEDQAKWWLDYLKRTGARSKS
ncbi:MAG: tetratricopeptide repeat protein [Gammaproteobacteria bacterium]